MNAQVSEWELGVELLDASGSPLEGYSRADCLLGRFDDTPQLVRWRDRKDLADLVGRPVRFRFYLRQGDLYAFQVHHIEPVKGDLIEPFPPSGFSSF